MHLHVRWALRVIAPLMQSVSDEIRERTFGFPKKTVNLEMLELRV